MMDQSELLRRIGHMTVEEILADDKYVALLTGGFFTRALEQDRLRVVDEAGRTLPIRRMHRTTEGVVLHVAVD